MFSPPSATYGIYLGDLDRGRTDSQGIISYSLALTRAVAAALAPAERLVVFASVAVRAELGDLASSGIVDVLDVVPATGTAQQMWHEQVGVTRLVRGAGLDVVHFPKGRAPWFGSGGPKVVATIHDDIPFQYRAGRFGSRTREPKSAYVVACLRRTLATADVVITDSEFSRRQLTRLRPTTVPIRVVVPGLTVEPLGDDCRAGARERAPQLLVFDSPFAHKRADEAVEFGVRYLHDRALADHRVILLGSGRGDAARTQYPTMVVREPSPVSTARVESLVRASRAVLVASRYEGLGLPALEAWALGTPAVVADSDAAREMLWGVPGTYAAGDYASFATALDDVLALGAADYDDWSKVVGARCDWERAAAEVLEVYRRLTR